MRRVVEVVLDVHAARDRRVDADELEVRADLEAVEEPGPDRRPARLDLRPEAQVEEQVVGELVAVVGALAVARVVVADGREERDAVDHVAVRLEEARVPLVVLVARAGRVLVAEVDVVAGRDDEPHAVLADRALERARDHQLAAALEPAVDDPDAEVAEHRERDRGVRAGRRERAEAVVVAAAGPHQRGLLDVPVVQLARAPLAAVDEHAVAVLRVRLEALDPDVVALARPRRRDHAAVPLDLDRRLAERLRAGADRLAARGRRDRRELLVVDDPPLAVRRVAAPEVEAAPRDQRLVVAEAGELQELLEVDVEVRHADSFSDVERDDFPAGEAPDPHARECFVDYVRGSRRS